MDKNTLRVFKSSISPFIITLLVMIIIMTFSIVIESLLNKTSIFETHILSILLSAVISSIIAYFIVNKYQSLINSAHNEIEESKKIHKDNDYIFSLLNSTIESTADGILVIDNSGKVSLANKKFSELWGIPQNLVDNKDDGNLLSFVLDKLKNPELFIQKVNELYSKPESQSFDILEFKDGRTFERLSFPQKSKFGVIGRVWNFRDITERKKAEETLLKFQLGIEHSYEAIFITDINGIINFVNPAFERIYGFSKEEAIGKTPRILKSGIISEEIYKNFWITLLSKKNVSGEIVNRKKDGSLINIEGENNPIIDHSGNIIGFMGIHRDITERKLTEESIKRERILLRTVIDNIPDAIYVKDSEYRKTLSNRADLDNMGCEKEEDAIGKTDFDFFPKEVAENFQADDEKIIKNGIPIINREEFFLDKNGNKNWLLTSKIPLHDEKGNISGLIGLGFDITNRKRSELIQKVLYDISESAHGISDLYSLFKMIHQVVGTLMSCKNFYIALYDEITDLISFPYFVDEIDPPQKPKKPGKGCTEYVLRKGEACLISAQDDFNLTQAGEVESAGSPAAIWLGVPLKISGKTIGVIVVQDYENGKAYGEEEKQLLTFVSEQIAQVIERKRKEEEIKRYTEELKEINKTKDKLFSIIAHDLRSPFNPILNLSEILCNEADSLNRDEIRQFSSDVYNSAKSVFILMENLLDWSRMQSGSIQFNPCMINLKLKTDKIIENLKIGALQKNIHLNNYVSESVSIKADDQMIHSVLHNLISNSIKFTPNGGEITVQAINCNNFTEISVCDNGVGISPDRLVKMFTIEKNISTKGTNQEKGTGLGLVLCKEFIEKHGGRIWVESELGKGSKFIFTIPSN